MEICGRKFGSLEVSRNFRGENLEALVTKLHSEILNGEKLSMYLPRKIETMELPAKFWKLSVSTRSLVEISIAPPRQKWLPEGRNGNFP